MFEQQWCCSPSYFCVPFSQFQPLLSYNYSIGSSASLSKLCEEKQDEVFSVISIAACKGPSYADPYCSPPVTPISSLRSSCSPASRRCLFDWRLNKPRWEDSCVVGGTLRTFRQLWAKPADSKWWFESSAGVHSAVACQAGYHESTITSHFTSIMCCISKWKKGSSVRKEWGMWLDLIHISLIKSW